MFDIKSLKDWEFEGFVSWKSLKIECIERLSLKPC